MLGDLCPPKPLDHISKKKSKNQFCICFRILRSFWNTIYFWPFLFFFVSFLSILSTKSIISQVLKIAKRFFIGFRTLRNVFFLFNDTLTTPPILKKSSQDFLVQIVEKRIRYEFFFTDLAPLNKISGYATVNGAD